MVGEGMRFRQAGYLMPKFEIKLAGHSLFYWSAVSLKSYIEQRCRFIFITQKKHNARAFIEQEAQKLGITDMEIVELDRLTKGQAHTVLFAEPHLDPAMPIAIYNIDTHVDSSQIPVYSMEADGIIPCFTATEDKWSFVRTDQAMNALEVREKKPISTNATLGFYWFSSYALYAATYHTYYSNPVNIEKNELYIAPLYNQLIAEGKKVKITLVDKHFIINMGTPQELEDAQKRCLTA